MSELALDRAEEAFAGIRTLFVGHGPPAAPAVLADQRRYLLMARETIARVADGRPQLGEDEATRALCEPDVRNRRMLGYCASLGADEIDRFPFGEKTAALLAWPREIVAASWADDLAAATAAGRAWDRMDGVAS